MNPTQTDQRPFSTIDFYRLPLNEPTEITVDSPAGKTTLTLTRTTGERPFVATINTIFDSQIIPGLPTLPGRDRSFANDLGVKIWLNSLERGLDGNLPPVPRA